MINEKFNLNKLTIFTQNGFKILNSNVEKLNLPKEFTLQRNGGIKTIINFNNKDLAFFSSNKSSKSMRLSSRNKFIDRKE